MEVFRLNIVAPFSLFGSHRWLLPVLFLFGSWTLNFPMAMAEEATPETIRRTDGNYRKWSETDAVGHLGGVPVAIPKEFTGFLEYDGDPGFLEKREEKKPERTFGSGIRGLGFSVRYPDMTPLNEQIWREKHAARRHITIWMHVGVRSNSRYGHDGPDKLTRFAEITLEEAELWHHYEQQPEKFHELNVFVPVDIDPSRSDSTDKNIYIHHMENNGIDTFIECSNMNHEAASCKQWFDLAPTLNADVAVVYRKGLLPRWREIQDGITRVLLNFRVDTSKTSSTQP
jgi:tRNA isopentenyl-2-thiomethyl-A-37 hydroxylase MiaE